MHMSNKVVPATLSFALALASTTLVADTEFGAEIPRDVVEQLVGNIFGTAPKLYSDILSGFPPFALPDGFEVAASADQGMQQRVILRTTRDDDEAGAAIVAALVAEGWMEMPVARGGPPRSGFISANAPASQPISLCSDALGRMGVSVTDGSGGKFVNLSRTMLAAFGGAPRSCAEEAEMMTAGPGGMRLRGAPGGVSEYLPQLIVPESDVATTPSGFISRAGGGGSLTDFETHGYVSITWDGEALMEHFAAQIAEQGWQPDTQVSGAQTAFGSWTKTVDGNALLGMLTLVETGGDNWDLKFRIVRTGSASANAAGDSIR